MLVSVFFLSLLQYFLMDSSMLRLTDVVAVTGMGVHTVFHPVEGLALAASVIILSEFHGLVTFGFTMVTALDSVTGGFGSLPGIQ